MVPPPSAMAAQASSGPAGSGMVAAAVRPSSGGSLRAILRRPPLQVDAGTLEVPLRQPPRALASSSTIGAAASTVTGDAAPGNGARPRLRPSTAGQVDFRRTGLLQRAASAPTLEGFTSRRPLSASLGGYKSKALALQVRLRERFAELEEADKLAMSSGTISVARLRIYSEAFEAILLSNEVFAPPLRKVKEAYDQSVLPWLGMEVQRPPAAGPHSSGSRSCLTSTQEEAAFAPRIMELQQENRRLRAAAGRLFRQRQQLQQQQQTGSNEAVLGAEEASGQPASPSAAKVLQQRRPWSAMRVTSHGVRC